MNGNSKVKTVNLAMEKRKMANLLQKKFEKFKQTGMKQVNTGVACTEPCSVLRCLKTCHQEADVQHEDHFCSDHKNRPKEQTQQQLTPQTRNFQSMVKTNDDHKPESVNLPVLVDSSEEERVPNLITLTDSSDIDTDQEDEEISMEAVKQKEKLTGQLDFDYHDVNMVKPSGQLRNVLKNQVSHLWSIVEEEFQVKGEPRRYREEELLEDGPFPDEKMVWWTEATKKVLKLSLIHI